MKILVIGGRGVLGKQVTPKSTRNRSSSPHYQP